MSEIMRRKLDHIELVLKQQYQPGTASPFDAVELEHNALPEMDLEEIDLSTQFLGHSLNMPFMVSSMTGGPGLAATINENLACAAQQLGIAMGVGSQRIAIERKGDQGLQGLRSMAPDVPLFANLGAAQLRDQFNLDDVRRAIDMIEANGLIIHLNPLQEALQNGGDVRWAGILDKMQALTRQISLPVIAKEVGMGISASTARRLVDAGIAAIDVAGKGGTSFSRVEGERSSDPHKRLLGDLFADWGISTPRAISDIRRTLPNLPLIASGGVRHGIDAAKALTLGADIVAQAGAVLQAATISTDAVVGHFEIMAQALRIACFCSAGIKTNE